MRDLLDSFEPRPLALETATLVAVRRFVLGAPE